MVGNHAAIIPTITGRAWITGQSTLMLDPDDPWPGGLQDFRHLAHGRQGLTSMKITEIPVTCLLETQDKLGEGCFWDAAAQMPVVARPHRALRHPPPARGERAPTANGSSPRR